MKVNRLLERLCAVMVAAVLAACGGASRDDSPGSTTPADSSPPAATAASVSTTSELIAAAQSSSEIDADTALVYQTYALFRDARLPARYAGTAAEEFDADSLRPLAGAWGRLPDATRRSLSPYLRRPAEAGSWAALAPATADAIHGMNASTGSARVGCSAHEPGWTTVLPDVGRAIRVWYDSARAGDATTAVQVAQAVDRAINIETWPQRSGAVSTGPNAALPPDDRSIAPSTDSTDLCNGGDARPDMYLVHGLNARGVMVPADARGAHPSAVFMLVNADLGIDTPSAAVQLLAESTLSTQTAQQAAARVTPRSERRQSAASRTPAAAGPAAVTAAAAPVAPAVLQSKSANLASGVTSITLNSAVTAGNWIAVAVSTIGTTPRNVLLSDNQAHADPAFAATASRYSSSFGTIWRYVKAGASGSYTLSADRAGASGGTVQVFEIANADPTTLLDIGSLSASGTSRTAAGTFASATTRDNDLLLSVVAVRAGSVTVTPSSPTGSAAVDLVQSGTVTARVMSFASSAIGTYRVAASISSSNAWRLSSLAIAGAAAAPVVVAPVNTALPVITVTDRTSYLSLATSVGSWSNTPTSYAYAWTRNGSAIAGATGATYDTTAADQGASVAAVVTASNSAGSASATSASVPVPVPGTPTAPALSLTASPTSIMQGQSSTLAWSSTNATSCAASGAWSGSKAISGSVAVTPAANATYTLACTGTGGTATAAATVTVTTAPPGGNPTLGAHAMVYHPSQGSVGPWLSTPGLATQSGSTMLNFVGKASIWNLSPPIDNKGNTPYVQVGAIHEYTKWPGEGTTVYAFNTIVGGSNHIVSVEDSNVWDEVTFAAVEVRNGGLIQDLQWNEVLNSTVQTSRSVTTTGPATLIAVWYGDDASATPSNPVPNNGFTVIEGNGGAVESVQMFVATKDVAGAGTYNVTWTTTPLQGAQLYLMAVQKR